MKSAATPTGSDTGTAAADQASGASSAPPRRRGPAYQRLFWTALIAALLVWGWRGWFDPELMLSWETLLALCGMR